MSESALITETSVLGGGCFWCIEAIFRRIQGVISVVSGYSGGHVENPTYQQVCGKQTGHAEVVKITSDPSKISFTQLMDIFWEVHDPTTLNRQGGDVGPQYRSTILFQDSIQEELAQASKAALEESGIYENKVVTEIVPFEVFYPSEPYHHDYYDLNPNQGYCRVVISPKVRKFEAKHGGILK